MSLDQVLFVLLLFAIPLLQRIVVAMRGRVDASPPGGAEPVTAERVAAGRPVESAGDRRAAFEESGPPPLASAPVPEGIGGTHGREAMVPPMPGRAPVGGRGRGLPATAPHPPARSLAERPRAIPNVVGASTPQRVALSGKDLRIALVRMAILGPCRALEPRDPSQVA